MEKLLSRPLTLEQTLASQIERKTEEAARILTHYLRQAIPGLDSDALAEMRTVVENVVDAACLRVVHDRLPRLKPAHGDAITGRAEITPLGSKALHSEDGFEADRPGPEFGA